MIIVVALIWGTIIYKFIFYQDDTTSTDIQYKEQLNKEDKKQMKDTFTLKCNYRDPFLSKTVAQYSEPKKQQSGNIKVIKPVINPVVKTVPWPDLKYCGLIQNLNSTNKTGLLRINKKEYVVTENQIVKELSIVKIYTDSLTVQLNEEKRTIKK